jgi:hypothetical protein
MNRTRKTKILIQFLQGEPVLLRKLKRTVYDNRLVTGEQARALTIEQLVRMSEAKIPISYGCLTDGQLEGIISAYSGKPCPNFEEMTDEQLDAIIQKGNA